jgi:hypothetical protein
LRNLVQRGEISVVRKGVKKWYHVASPIRRGRSSSSTAMIVPESAPLDLSPAQPETGIASPTTSIAPLPHKLAVGEVLVLEINEEHVLTATNEHGRVVIERHPVP